MSYLVIARKWRPSVFEDVIGQEHVTKTLTNAIKSGRIAHAYLFSGSRGVGKTSVARIFAKSLNCEKGPTVTPCNECKICKAITEGQQIDVQEIDAASNTGVDNVREICENVRYAPSEARFKIFIIDEVHMLSKGAFNALLKTLEEPPPYVKFIFATTEPHKVLPTIHSRCQRFDFKRIPFKKLEDSLSNICKSEEIEIEDNALYSICREAEGSMRDGQSLLDQVIAFSGKSITNKDVIDSLGLMDRSVVYDILRAIIDGKQAEILNIIDNIYNFGFDLKKGASDLLETVRNLIVITITGTSDLLDLPDSEVKSLENLAKDVKRERLELIFSILSKGYEDLVRSSTPRYSFELSLLKASEIDLKSITELLEMLPQLKKNLTDNSEPLNRAQNAKPEASVSKKKEAPLSKYESISRLPDIEKIKKAEKKEENKQAEEVKSNEVKEPKKDYNSLNIDERRKLFINKVKEKDNVTAIRLKEMEITFDDKNLTLKGNKDCAGFLKNIKEEILKEVLRDLFPENLKLNIIEDKNIIEEKQPGKKDDKAIKTVINAFKGKVVDEFRRD